MITQLIPPLAVAATVGLLSGAHSAIWGMYKDAVHEGFAGSKFARSMLIGAIGALVVQTMLGLSLPSPASLVLLFGLAYAIERGFVETWKTFVRVEDQSKYFIPMQFSFGGVPVRSRITRLIAGAAYVGGIAACLYAIAQLDRETGTLAPAARAALVGLAVGAVIAISGCWKDAPTEGFDLLKFFRSPVTALVIALPICTAVVACFTVAL